MLQFTRLAMAPNVAKEDSAQFLKSIPRDFIEAASNDEWEQYLRALVCGNLAQGPWSNKNRYNTLDIGIDGTSLQLETVALGAPKTTKSKKK